MISPASFSFIFCRFKLHNFLQENLNPVLGVGIRTHNHLWIVSTTRPGIFLVNKIKYFFLCCLATFSPIICLESDHVIPFNITLIIPPR